MSPDWLMVTQGDAPLIVAIPHAGLDLPDPVAACFPDPALARKDADHHVDRLYAFAARLGASVIATRISRSAIDVNRDPSGASLYPGMTTTELCPLTTFDGEPLYAPGAAPDAAAIAARRARWFDPYHAAIVAECARLRTAHGRVVLYDAHSIRSVVPRLFEGALPHFNIGTNDGRACDPALARAVAAACDLAGWSQVIDGRFKGGWTTRHHGQPDHGVHAIQMELAMRAYLDEAVPWPPRWDAERAEPCRAVLATVLACCIDFARGTP